MGTGLNTRGSIKSTLTGIALIAGLLCLGFFLFLLQGSPGTETKDVLIPRGLSLKSVSDLLSKEGIIRHPVIFQNLLRLTNGNKKVRAGEFRFRTGANLLNTLKVLYHSEPITHSITVPEGWNIRQIASVLQEKNLVRSDKFIQLALAPNSAKKYQLSTPHLEGFLYPDTYFFSRIDGEEKILETMVNRFFQEYQSRFKARVPASGMTLEKVVTLASIVEKETGKPSERPLIASVFFNRLKKGMRLQSDPTTIYGIENFNGNITKSDLQRWTPYNTYTISGLPPGPIASPGKDAIEAVLNPQPSEYLYFVSNNNGSHLFSKTYKEHLRSVQDYQINRRQN